MRPSVQQRKFRRPVEAKSMTIGIGYLTNDAVVLGSDMELTGVARFKGHKHFIQYFDKNKGVAIAIYSGLENDIRCVWEEFEERVKREAQRALTVPEVRKFLAAALKEVLGNRKSHFQMLVAIAHPDHNPNFFGDPQPAFFRVHGSRITPAKDWEIIGAGDCELTRYLTQVMSRELEPRQAALWMTHIIGLSNKLVPTVGQGIRIISISGAGKFQVADGSPYAQKLDELDEVFAELWADLYEPYLSEEQLEGRIKSFVKDAMRIRKETVRIWQK